MKESRIKFNIYFLSSNKEKLKLNIQMAILPYSFLFSTNKIFSFPLYISPYFPPFSPFFERCYNVKLDVKYISNTDTHEDTQPVIKLANQHRLMTRNNVGHGCTVSFIFQPGGGGEENRPRFRSSFPTGGPAK